MRKQFNFLLLLLFLSTLSFAQIKEKWINSPKEEWPQIALTNHVQFKNGDRYVDPSYSYAGTGFLINTGEDTLAATVKHILWVAKNKSSRTVQINEDLKQWAMIPKGSFIDSALVDKLLNEDSTEILEGAGSSILERDWLVFSLKYSSPNIYPLKPRYTPLNNGEKVYMISSAYSDSIATVYNGSVVRKLGMDILIDLNTKPESSGTSGSPIIDSDGYLIGIVSQTTSDNKTGKSLTVAISTEYLFDVLNKKAGLNSPKKDYGELLLKTVLERGTKKAIQKYTDLTNNPQNYYDYNLRSANRNGLREVGEKLIQMNRIKDAIEILEFNVQMNRHYFFNYNLLAKAHLLDGNKNKAEKYYQVSTTKFQDKNENEAFKALEEMKAVR